MRNQASLIFLVILSFLWNASSCELECNECLPARLILIPEGNSGQRMAKADFPFHSIVNLEANEEIWNIDTLSLGSIEDTIYVRYYDYVFLPLHPDKKISSFDFKDANGSSIGNVVYEVDFEVVYDGGCKDYELHVEGEPIIDIDLENLDITINSDNIKPCLPVLELRL